MILLVHISVLMEVLMKVFLMALQDTPPLADPTTGRIPPYTQVLKQDPVTGTYILLRSSVPMWFVVGMKYLLNTGGPLSLPAYMYWGFLFALGLTAVLLSNNIMESYIQTRFLHRSVKQIINVSDKVEVDASPSSLQKVSVALK